MTSAFGDKIGDLLNESLTINHDIAGPADEFGNPTVASTTHTPTVGFLEQHQATEQTADRDTAMSDWKGYLPADAAVGPSDSITDSRDRTFAVIGAPWGVVDPTTNDVHHLELNLRWVTDGG